MFRGNRGGAESKPGRAEVRAIIADMDSLMFRDRRYNHAGVPSQVAIEVVKMGAVASFKEFEEILREMDSKVHFIGVPLDFYGPEWADKTVNLLDPTSKPEYTL